MGDPVENNFPRCRLGPLNRVLLRIPIQEDVQFRHFGNPTTIDFAVKLDRELHSHTLPPLMQSGVPLFFNKLGRPVTRSTRHSASFSSLIGAYGFDLKLSPAHKYIVLSRR
jgi:hypothetical protein